MKIKMAGIAKISALAIHKYEFASLSILPNRALAAATIPNIPAAMATKAEISSRLRQPRNSTGSDAMVKKITETETQGGHILNIK
jgi:hypothetical protein